MPKKYVVDERCGCIAVRTERSEDARDYNPGLHQDDHDVHLFWQGNKDKHGHRSVSDDQREHAKEVCDKLNSELEEHIFIPNVKTIKTINGLRTTDELKYEPMLFQADLKFSYENGGPVTKEVIDSIIDDVNVFTDKHIVIDTRVTMTMAGTYPSIPGWHCDAVPRSEKYDQPDLSKINSHVKHYMVLLSDVEAHTCTEFVEDVFKTHINKENVWGGLHEDIEESNVKTRFIKPGEVIVFDQNSIHRASPTVNPGWRYFFRLSLVDFEPANEIRKQVQVYSPMNGGW